MATATLPQSPSPERNLFDFLADCWFEIPSLKPSEWANRYRYLSPERTHEHGKYRCERIPMQREPMDSAVDPTVSETVLWWAAQTAGKTEVLFNIGGYFIHADPSTILYVLPNVEQCEEYSRDGLAPMLRDCPCFRGVVADPRSRDSGNTIMGKRFRGGSWVFAGANAPAGLAGRPRRVVLKDEIDRYPPSAGTEGDPCALADKRAESYGEAAVKISTSTATIKGASRIESKYELSDKQCWFVTCPKCRHEFVMMFFQNVRWTEGELENAWIECPGSKCRLNDAERVAMVKAGRWKATAPFRGVRGYWLNGLVTLFDPLKGYKSRIHQFASEFLEAKSGGRQTFKAWTNTFLAETWDDDEGEKVNPDDVLKRCEEYDTESLPAGILVLTAGGDVHRMRIEVEIKGWGVDEESWGVRKFVLEGDTEKDEIWAALDVELLKSYKREDGLEMKLERTFIDMGHKDRRVLAFCAPRLNRGIYPCRGVNRIGLNPPPLLPAKPSRNNKARIPHWNIGVTVAKTAIYDRLLLPVPEARSMHFPVANGYGLDYFKQLTAEKRKKKFMFGRPYFIFEKENNGVRNEALDLNVYALAALHSLAPILWNKLAANLKKQAQTQQATAAKQMVAEEMKAAPTEQTGRKDTSAALTAEKSEEIKSAEMDASGKITPAAEPPLEVVLPPKPHHRRTGFRPRGGFVGRW